MAVFAAACLGCAAAAGAGPYEFTVPPVDQVLDLHGNPANAQLVIFMAGNQYMVVPALLSAFRKSHPQIRSVFYETLPPGIVARVLAAGGLRMGNLVITAKPDVFLAGKRRIRALQAQGRVGGAFSYATNVLAIMIRRGNPKHIVSLRDLGRADVRVSMPNPQWEGVAEQIETAYRKAGGEPLVRAIMTSKVAAGTTILTRIHHRQTPLFLREGRADAGPVWLSEARYQSRLGTAIGMVSIPASQNVAADYEAAEVRGAPHAQAAREFLAFLRSPQARAIFASYGFGPPLIGGKP